MDKVGLKQGLIRYASEQGIAKRQKLKFTPRIRLYSLLLLTLISGLAYGIITRSDTETTILRTPGMLYQTRPDGRISNLYNYKIINKVPREFPVEFKLENVQGEIQIVGNHHPVAKNQEISEGEFFIIVNPDLLTERKNRIEIGVYSGDLRLEIVKTTFLGKRK
jgi:hypothetical protein